MGKEFQLKFPVEGRRLLWLMVLVFAMVFIVQYFELPYGNVFLSSLSVGKSKVASVGNFSVGNSSSSFQNSSDSRNLMFSDGLNFTDPSNLSEISVGKDANEKHSEDNSDNADPEDESPSKDFIELNGIPIMENARRNDTLAPEKARENDSTATAPAPAPAPYIASRNNSSLVAPTSAEDETKNSSISNSSVSVQPLDSSPVLTSPAGVETNSRAPVLFNPNTSSVSRDASKTAKESKNPGFSKTDIPPLINYTFDDRFPKIKESSLALDGAEVPISEMNNMLLQSLTSPHSMRPRWTSSADQELLHAKFLIENAPNIQDDPNLYPPLF